MRCPCQLEYSQWHYSTMLVVLYWHPTNAFHMCSSNFTVVQRISCVITGNPFKGFNQTGKTFVPWQRQMRCACLFLKIKQQDIQKPTCFSNNNTGVSSKLFMSLIHYMQCIFLFNKAHLSCFQTTLKTSTAQQKFSVTVIDFVENTSLNH